MALGAAADDQSLFPIVRKLKLGFINRAGQVVVEPQFDAQPVDDWFREGPGEGPYPVSKELQWGYIDRKGAIRIPLQYSLAAPFFEGRAAVRVESKYGYIDAPGAMKIPARFDHAGRFLGRPCPGLRKDELRLRGP